MSQALILGLIVNELATNSFKYAFNEKSSGEISISLQQVNQNLIVIYCDNGVGIKNGFDIQKGGFGFKLISILSQQINATITYEFQNGNSQFTIQVPNGNVI